LKIGQTAKEIDNLLTDNGNRYARNFGNYMGTCTNWNEKRSKWDKVDSKFVARKYSQIIELVKEIKPLVTVEPTMILISYNEGKGEIRIGRDILVDNFLLPLITA
jgi:hypothetical protein